MTSKNEEKICGSMIYKAANCRNKVRKIAHNKFENILLCGRHAFDYSVITENRYTGELKELIFPNRNEAVKCFTLIQNRYKKI